MVCPGGARRLHGVSSEPQSVSSVTTLARYCGSLAEWTGTTTEPDRRQSSLFRDTTDHAQTPRQSSVMVVITTTSLCSASYVGRQRGTARICPPHAAAAKRRPRSNRSIFPARRAHSSKPAAASLLLWAHATTDGRTDTIPIHRPVRHTMRAMPINAGLIIR